MSAADLRIVRTRPSLDPGQYLFNVKQQQELENLHSRQERSEQNAQPEKKKSSYYLKTPKTDITLSVAGSLPCQCLSVDEFEDVPGDIKNWLPVPLQDPLRKQPAWKRVFKGNPRRSNTLDLKLDFCIKKK